MSIDQISGVAEFWTLDKKQWFSTLLANYFLTLGIPIKALFIQILVC
ncbi:MAG: hypothetical protein QNJ63_20400 [Calothrix sp. MO_192.B10]|nr:hypothetical protein [Calothrix sp. MO_192.B10]